MTAAVPDLLQEHRRSDWVRLRTLVMLRWVAIGGQIGAIGVAVLIYGMIFEVGLAVLVVGASVLLNLCLTILYPEAKRLSEREATQTLVFDILQLGLLLGLTGGLHNPFALLLLAPVTIAATVLHLRSTILLGLLAIAVITALRLWSLPLLTPAGLPIRLPELYLFGFWLALIVGIGFLSVYARQVTMEMATMGEALVATQLALAREQKLTDLGGVVAATAHELGTPLATIKLVSAELAEELADHPALREDADLIHAQADRCRDILHSMGRAGNEDLLVLSAPVEAVIREAAEPHMDRGKAVHIALSPSGDGAAARRQPTILRRPEVVHGLRNLIQNAVDFAQSTVEIEIMWSADALSVRIEDDGLGFPPSLIWRLGDPFVRRRRSEEEALPRPGYKGMGLGLFIAKTLLERTGARLAFANGAGLPAELGATAGGAIVQVTWPLAALTPNTRKDGAPQPGLGQNRPLPT